MGKFWMFRKIKAIYFIKTAKYKFLGILRFPHQRESLKHQNLTNKFIWIGVTFANGKLGTF